MERYGDEQRTLDQILDGEDWEEMATNLKRLRRRCLLHSDEQTLGEYLEQNHTLEEQQILHQRVSDEIEFMAGLLELLEQPQPSLVS